MAGKPTRGSHFHLSPELAGMMFLPVGLGLVYLATAAMCFIIHWS
jgi:hypothetical protein